MYAWFFFFNFTQLLNFDLIFEFYLTVRDEYVQESARIDFSLRQNLNRDH